MEWFCENTQNPLALEPNVTHEVLTRKRCACVSTVKCSVYSVVCLSLAVLIILISPFCIFLYWLFNVLLLLKCLFLLPLIGWVASVVRCSSSWVLLPPRLFCILACSHRRKHLLPKIPDADAWRGAPFHPPFLCGGVCGRSFHGWPPTQRWDDLWEPQTHTSRWPVHLVFQHLSRSIRSTSPGEPFLFVGSLVAPGVSASRRPQESLISMEYKILLVLQHIGDSIRALVASLYPGRLHNGPACLFESRLRRWIILLHRALCQWGASWVMSKCTTKSRYLTHSSVQLCANWDALQTSSLCHRSHIEVYLSCPFSLHLLMHLWLYDGLFATDYDDMSFLLKWLVQYDSSGLSMLRMLLGFGPTYFYWVVPTCHIDTWSCLEYVFQARRTLSSLRNLFQLAHLHVTHLIDCAARCFFEYHPIFRQVVANRNLVWSSFYFVHLLVDFSHFCFILQDCVLRNSLYSEINVNVRLLFNLWLRILHRLPWAISSTSCITSDVSYPVSCHPDWLSHFATTFEVLIYNFIANKQLLLLLLLLLLDKPIAFQRNFGCWPWGWESFEQDSISFLRDYSEDAFSWHRIVGDDRKWLRFPKFQS